MKKTLKEIASIEDVTPQAIQDRKKKGKLRYAKLDKGWYTLHELLDVAKGIYDE